MHQTGRKILPAHVSHAQPRSARRSVLAAVVLTAAAILPYLNSLQGEFHFDDDGQIVGNENLNALPALLYNSPPARWLTFATFRLNARLHRFDFMPGWHAVNIALHAGCTVALYWVLTLLAGAAAPQRIPGSRTRGPLPTHDASSRAQGCAQPGTRTPGPETRAIWPFLAAVIFAVHPLASEPVNYIQARSVILYTLFTLLALCGTILVHRGPTRQRRLVGLVLALASVLLAATSKEVGCFFALIVPGLYLLLFAVPMVTNKQRLWFVVAGALVALLAAAAIWIAYSGAGQGISRRLSVSLGWHWWGQVVIFWRYMLRAVLPLPSLLSVDHAVAYRVYRLANPDVLASFTGLLGLVVIAAVLLPRSRPLTSMLLLLIPLGLAPYFVMTSWEMMVEYRFYLPLTAFCALAAMALLSLPGTSRRLAPLGAIVMLVLLGALTMERNKVWRTDVSLWTDAVEKAPRKARAVNGLAWALLKDKSAPDPRRALELAERSFDPRLVDLPPGYNPYMTDTLAEACYANGLYDRAVQLEQTVIRRGYTDPLFLRQLQRFEAGQRASRHDEALTVRERPR